jgi:hypothetical protein
MSSEKQTNANRENARHSTGPRTPQGKATVARNALKHGLLARDLTLPIEEQKQVEAVFEAFVDDLRPAGATEEFLVHQMASALHRLQHLTRIETGLIDSSMDKIARFNDEPEFDEDNPEETYQYHTRIMGRAFNWANFWKVARYENQIRRSFYKAIEELRRLRLNPLGCGSPAEQELEQEPKPEPEPEPVGQVPDLPTVEQPPDPSTPVSPDAEAQPEDPKDPKIGFVPTPRPTVQPEQTKQPSPAAQSEIGFVSSNPSQPLGTSGRSPVSM